jgi:S1-C subfamily serine protease
MRVDHASILAQRLSTDTYVPAGVCVREVAPDCPAAKAFKALADVPPTSWLITKVNGNAVSKPADFYEAAKGQDSLKLTVVDPAAKPPQERELIIP